MHNAFSFLFKIHANILYTLALISQKKLEINLRSISNFPQVITLKAYQGLYLLAR